MIALDGMRPTPLDCHYLRFFIGHSSIPDKDPRSIASTQAWIIVQLVRIDRLLPISTILPSQRQYQEIVVRSFRLQRLEQNAEAETQDTVTSTAVIDTPKSDDIIYSADIAPLDWIHVETYRTGERALSKHEAYPFVDILDSIPLPPEQWPIVDTEQVSHLLAIVGRIPGEVRPIYDATFNSWWYISCILEILALQTDITLAIVSNGLGIAGTAKLYAKSTGGDDITQGVLSLGGRICVEDKWGAWFCWWGERGLSGAIRQWHASTLETHFNRIRRYTLGYIASEYLRFAWLFGIRDTQDAPPIIEGRSTRLIVQELGAYDKILHERFRTAYESARATPGYLPRSFDRLCPDWVKIPPAFVLHHVTQINPIVGSRLEWTLAGPNRAPTIHEERRRRIEDERSRRRRALYDDPIGMAAVKQQWKNAGLPDVEGGQGGCVIC